MCKTHYSLEEILYYFYPWLGRSSPLYFNIRFNTFKNNISYVPYKTDAEYFANKRGAKVTMTFFRQKQIQLLSSGNQQF